MGSNALDIARIIPSLREVLPELPESPAVQSDQERFRLFDSITYFLRNVARDDSIDHVLPSYSSTSLKLGIEKKAPHRRSRRR